MDFLDLLESVGGNTGIRETVIDAGIIKQALPLLASLAMGAIVENPDYGKHCLRARWLDRN